MDYPKIVFIYLSIINISSSLAIKDFHYSSQNKLKLFHFIIFLIAFVFFKNKQIVNMSV